MVEGGAELVQLLLGDALAVTGQNLVLNLVDRPVHWGGGNDMMWFTIRRNHSFVFSQVREGRQRVSKRPKCDCYLFFERSGLGEGSSFCELLSSHSEGATLYLYQKSQKRGSNTKLNVITSLN